MTNNPMLAKALIYAANGWHVFPVTPNAKLPLGSLVTNGFHGATKVAETITHWWTEAPNVNIGLNLAASGLVCIDVDSYKPDCAFDEYMLGKDMPKTLVQHSASGGTHYIFKAGENAEYPGKLCKGVDVKHNGYILLSPSVFKGNQYEWSQKVRPSPAPEWLSKPSTSFQTVVTPSAWLDGLPPEELLSVIAEEGWHNTVLKLVGSMVAKGRNDTSIHTLTDVLTTEAYCVAETREEVQKMIDGARRKQFGSDLPSTLQTAVVETHRGNIVSNYHNVFVTLFDRSPWSQVFAFDELAGRKMIMSKPPGERGNPSLFKPRQLKESDYTKVLKWLNQNGFPSVSKQLVIDCVQELCEENIVSPVRHYLESLAFDPQIDEPQLSFWMERYLGVEPTTDEERRYVEAVSRLSLIQAVARALNPGCKADSVPILEGGQGIGKSTAIRILHGAEWFGDALPPMSHKDASDYIRGKWGIELAELAFQQKAEVETQKSFISRREERFRPAYGREEICYPRRCVFWGTTNRSDYVKDDTGNRRFLPVKTTQVDVEGLRANRDKLWAEAVFYFYEGEQYWLSGQLAVFANDQAKERVEDDPWVTVIQERLAAETEVSLKQACTNCFPGLSDHQITTQMTRRMSLCLQQAGWEKDGRFTSGVQRNQVRFVKDAEANAKTISPDRLHDF